MKITMKLPPLIPLKLYFLAAATDTAAIVEEELTARISRKA